MDRNGECGKTRKLAGLAALMGMVLGGCASIGDRGWRGDGAEPFDGAKAACESEAAAMPEAERTRGLETCMAKRGWHRP